MSLGELLLKYYQGITVRIRLVGGHELVGIIAGGGNGIINLICVGLFNPIDEDAIVSFTVEPPPPPR